MADMDPMVVAPSDGVTRGDSKAMPNRGTMTGFTGIGNDQYGGGFGVNDTNAKGSAHLAPDPMDACCPPGGGDMRSGSSGQVPMGRSMGGAADSDNPHEDEPSTQQIPAVRETEPAGDED